ncbi:MAG: HNH endonuclease signature motif containing protein [bacterium]|nr:HNH endonuclease signature motif containing protein [bacterium]
MAISDKTRKVLWARSGNRCAICRRELVNESTQLDDEAIVGEECHIVAREANGARGDSPLPIDERDKPANLILLCRNHHKEVDDQPNTFTAEVLTKMKAVHETWVRKKLTARKEASLPVFFAFRVDTGTELCSSAMGTDAFQFNNDQPKTQQEAELIGGFSQSLQDYGDMWSDVEAKDRVLAQLEFDRQIAELNQQGFVVYAAERRERWKFSEIERPFHFTTAYVLVVREDNPLAKRKDDKIERLMRLNAQKESGFTNFIPVLRGTSSVRLL